MMIEKYPALSKQILNTGCSLIAPEKVLPSMRAVRFAGTAIARNNSRIL